MFWRYRLWPHWYGETDHCGSRSSWNGDLSIWWNLLPGGCQEPQICGIIRNWLQLFKKKVGREKSSLAICAAPIVLARAGLLKRKTIRVTMVLKKRSDGQHERKQWWKTVPLTSRGLNCSCLAYALQSNSGGDAQSLRKGMLYQDVFGMLKRALLTPFFWWKITFCWRKWLSLI